MLLIVYDSFYTRFKHTIFHNHRRCPSIPNDELHPILKFTIIVCAPRIQNHIFCQFFWCLKHRRYRRTLWNCFPTLITFTNWRLCWFPWFGYLFSFFWFPNRTITVTFRTIKIDTFSLSQRAFTQILQLMLSCPIPTQFQSLTSCGEGTYPFWYEIQCYTLNLSSHLRVPLT